MTIHRHKRFKKQFQKLSPRIQQQADAAIKRLVVNPYEPRLHNHALHGELQGRRAFSVTGDIRIIFREEHDYQDIYLLMIGTHSQVY